jgi:outer membrane protein W
MFSLNALYRIRTHPTPSFPHGRFQPYVGAGPTFYVLHPENTINGHGNAQKYKSSGVGWQALVGFHYGISRRTGIFVEGKYNSGKAKVATADGGWAETDLRTWHLEGGMRYGY